nr:MAG: major capsid protein [Microviridae sp.]
MNQTFSNVMVQDSTLRKSKFNLSKDVNTTYGWGELQPINCRLLQTAGNSSFTVNTLVRANPLVSPTFGRIFHKQYHQFVPLSDIFPNYEQILTATPKAQIAQLDGIPQPASVLDDDLPENVPQFATFSDRIIERFPTITPAVLLAFVLQRANYRVYNYNETTKEVTPFTDPVSTDNLIKLCFPKTRQENNNLIKFIWEHDTSLVSGTEPMRVGDDFWSPDSGDYTIVTKGITDPQHKYIVSFRLNRQGKRLRKVLIGLGYQLLFDDTVHVSCLQLLACYKAYFDIFRIPQYDNWKTSACYRLIEAWQHGASLFYHYYSYAAQTSQSFIDELYNFIEELGQLWYTEDSDYVSSHIEIGGFDGQEFTGQLPATDPNQFDKLVYSDVVGSRMSVNQRFESLPFGQMLFSNDGTSQLDIELLKKMYISCNRQSQIGYDIASLLRAQGYDAFVDSCKSNFIGSYTMPITVDQVMTTATTADASTGDYAGAAAKYDASPNFSFENNEIGFIISLATIVPQAGYCQNIDPQLFAIDRFTFYNPEFDGFGYELTPRAAINAAYGYEDYTGDSPLLPSASFGQIPRYTGLKVASDTLNGDMSLYSMRHTYLPYQLDRVFYQNYLSTTPLAYDGSEDPKPIKWRLDPTGSPFPNAGKSWRFPTRYANLGNFNRIFQNGDIENLTYRDLYDYETVDNFMSHAVITFDNYAAMLPVSQSWPTYDHDRNVSGKQMSAKK